MRIRRTFTLVAFAAVLTANLGLVACGAFSSDDASNVDAGTGDDGGVGDADAGTDALVRKDGPSEDAACALTDFSTDPRNCGKCDHSCLGGGCEAGTCLPFEVGSEADGIIALAVSTKFVYWLPQGRGTVVGCPLAGCTMPLQFASGLPAPFGLAAVGEDVAVADNSQVSYVTSVGGTTQLAAYAGVRVLVSDSNGVLYYVAAPGGMGFDVYQLDRAGDAGPKPIFGSGVDNDKLTNIAVADGHLYSYFSTAKEEIFVCDVPNCANKHSLVTATPLDSSQVEVAAAKDGFYYNRPANGPILECAAGTCPTPTAILPKSTGEVMSLAADDTYIYFSTGSGGDIKRCLHGGCASAITVARGANPHALTSTSDALYWATDGSGVKNPGVWRLAK